MPTWEEIQQGIRGVLQPLGEYANIATLMPNWIKAIQALPYMIQEQPIPPELTPENPSFSERIAQTLQNLKKNLPTNPDEMMEKGLPFMPSVGAVIRPNFRNPEQIRALRRIMAEEQRARGPLQENILRKGKPQVFTSGYELPDRIPFKASSLGYVQEPDPIDQILRGSWYHGMSQSARNKIPGADRLVPDYIDVLPWESTKGAHPDMSAYMNNLMNKLRDVPRQSKGEWELYHASKEGFPISRHDTQSISNKLGEPAGVSLSLNPTVSSKFSADENIFRVMPLYGGPPTQRTVNLMTPEGRKLLNDAYDVVANQYFMKQDPWTLRHEGIKNTVVGEPYNQLERLLSGPGPYSLGTGKFNQQLSDQLQGQGYRHILYNPQRWNEYEMLALDPKYALPLDYRSLEDYRRAMYDYANKKDTSWMVPATPKANQGIESIQDLMSQNASRLGDIYKERSWWDRINEGIKQVLLQDNPNAEQIIQKLKGK